MNDNRIPYRSAIHRRTVLIVTLLAALAASCVGSENRDRGRDRGDVTQAANEGATAVRAYPDTVSPVTYHIFDRKTVSEQPRKELFRLLVMSDATTDALVKTIRVALDSVSRADSSLAAARAILYRHELVTPRQGALIPRLWGEWVPPEGWDAAGTRSRRKAYRSFIYNDNPGWAAAAGSHSPGKDR